MGRDGPPDRYEPLPSLPEIPRWLWRRASRAVRIGLGAAALVLVVAVALLIPTISGSKHSDQERAAREHRAQQARLARALQEEQRPILKRSNARGDGLEDRARMLDAIAAAILADARERVRTGALNGPIRRVHCQPFPNGSEPADRDPDRRRGRYSCLAVTATFEGGLIGHQYRVAADFRTGRYGFCKITGRAGPERDRPVTIPAACGGDAYGGG